MKAVLFVSNGHGEIAIAGCIAERLRTRGVFECDHLALVGSPESSPVLRTIGPRAALPSGGLVAMGNVRNIARDLCAGLAGLTFRQWRFLRAAHGRYCAAIAVGDVYALFMALQARGKATIFVGTAKSVHVAPYGAFERSIIRRARAAFVRDEPTAQTLRRSEIAAQAGNVIADLAAAYARGGEPDADAMRTQDATLTIAVFPGSRDSAYEDAAFLLDVVRDAARSDGRIRAHLSIAPGLQTERFAEILRDSGWRVETSGDAQALHAFDGERELVRATRGPGEALLPGAVIALGQAGTANEAAAAAGVPVIAFVSGAESRAWYRKRQVQLLGDALMIAPKDRRAGARALLELLNDPARRARMAQAGRERMGPPGAAERIARSIEAACA